MAKASTTTKAKPAAATPAVQAPATTPAPAPAAPVTEPEKEPEVAAPVAAPAGREGKVMLVNAEGGIKYVDDQKHIQTLQANGWKVAK